MILRCRSEFLEQGNRAAMTLFATVTIITLWQSRLEVIAAPPGKAAVDKISSTTGDVQPAAVTPLSLAYVPRDAYMLAAIRPRVILKNEAFAPLNDFLSRQNDLKRHVGIPLGQIEQITLIQFTSEDESPACVFHLTRSDDAAELTKVLQADPEQRVYAGRKYACGKPDSANKTCVFTDNQIVVVTDNEEDLRRLMIAGIEGASKAKWTQEWQLSSDADAFLLANIKAIRSLEVLEGNVFKLAFSMLGVPSEFNFVIEASTVSVTIRIADKVQVKVRRDSRHQEDAQKNCDSLKAVVELFQVIMSTQRSEASKDPTNQGVELLKLIDLVDSLLDTMTFQGDDRTVTASTAITLEDVSRIVKAAIAASVRD
ncbi:MAG: hypothetical protein JWP89_5821 [Schlesneria sp.]|nr:hypothetical protein [Schlesneria sp.]